MKTAVRLARAVPTGGAPRRVYTPGGPLFAMRPLKFQGAAYSKGDALPVEKMDRARHWKLWTSGLASHLARGPFDKRKAKTEAAPVRRAPSGEAVVVEDLNKEFLDTFGSGLTALAVTPGEAIPVETTAQRDARRKKK